MQTFRNLSQTDEPVLSPADIDVIFHKVPDLQEAHDTFVNELQPRVEQWTDGQEVAEPIKVLVRNTQNVHFGIMLATVKILS